MVYAVNAPALSWKDMASMEAVKGRVIEELVDATQGQGGPAPMADVRRRCEELLSGYGTVEKTGTLAYLVSHDVAGTGPFSILMDDSSNLEEIEVNAPTSAIMVYHSKYGRCTTNLRFQGERDFRYSINRLISQTNRELNDSSPIIDAQLCDGSRLHAQLRPYSVSGAAASIRLNVGKGVDVKRLLELGTASEEMLAYLWMAIESSHSLVVAGAPASGKSSLVLALHAFVPRHERVITVEEDINELKFYGNTFSVVPLQGSSRLGEPSLSNQVANALHMRPDRLVVGELRGPEARDVFCGANLGVPFMTTMHSSADGQAIIARLESRPMSVEDNALSMLDVSVFMRRLGGASRRIEGISEYLWLSRAEIGPDPPPTQRMRTLSVASNFIFHPDALKESKVIRRYCELYAMSQASAISEFRKRARFLKAMRVQKLATPADTIEYILSRSDIR